MLNSPTFLLSLRLSAQQPQSSGIQWRHRSAQEVTAEALGGYAEDQWPDLPQSNTSPRWCILWRKTSPPGVIIYPSPVSRGSSVIRGPGPCGVYWYVAVYVAKGDKLVDIFLPRKGQAAKPVQAVVSNFGRDTPDARHDRLVKGKARCRCHLCRLKRFVYGRGCADD